MELVNNMKKTESVCKRALTGGIGGLVSYLIVTPRERWNPWGVTKSIAVGGGVSTVVGVAVDAVWK